MTTSAPPTDLERSLRRPTTADLGALRPRLAVVLALLLGAGLLIWSRVAWAPRSGTESRAPGAGVLAADAVAQLRGVLPGAPSPLKLQERSAALHPADPRPGQQASARRRGETLARSRQRTGAERVNLARAPPSPPR